MLSVIAVNYNSSLLLKECFSSIASTIGAEDFEFIAVDSGSTEEEIAGLVNLKGANVKIILSRENIGYAKAVNRGIKDAAGDVILITNPDVVYMPGSIKLMADALSELSQCGAVGPKAWWNKKMTFLLPISDLVMPHRIFMTELARVSRMVHKAILKRWTKKTFQYWLSERPMKQEMLSGACIMTTRKILDNVGGFDDSFPLYFEDTDWSLRVKKAGYQLYAVPQANIIHYYNQSAKQEAEASSRKYNESSEKYLNKHFGKGQLSLFRFFIRLIKARNSIYPVYEERGALNAPPVFTFRDVSKKLFLLSPVDLMIPSAGSFFEGNSFVIPEDLWTLLGEGRYYVRAVDLPHFHDCGSWQWTKKA